MLSNHVQVRVEVSHLRGEVVGLATDYEVEGLQIGYRSLMSRSSLDGHRARVSFGSEPSNYETVDNFTRVV